MQNAPPSASVRRNPQIVQHLLRECSKCQERSRAHLSPKDGYEYSAAFARAEWKLSEFFAMGRAPEAPPEVLLAELGSFPENNQLAQVSVNRRYASSGLIEILIESSHAMRYKDPHEMVRLSELARAVAETCTVEDAGSASKLADLRGRAWGHFGNSLRVCGQAREAGEALATSQRYISEGTGDPPLRARLLEQQSSLRMLQGCYPHATELAEEAAAIYQEIGQMHEFASALVHKAIACHYAGDSDEAVVILNRAIPLIDHEKNPHLLLAACHNLVFSYTALDLHEQALSLYFEIRDLYKEFDDDLNLLRMCWQEGQLLREMGHLQAAEAALLQARNGFQQRNLAHDTAMVSLDLAWVYVKLGRIDSLKQTVTEAIPIFTALRVGREALAALLQLQHAAGQEQQALELIRLLNSRLAPLASRR
jgi:tetratricopeptide (TPR) repeat protein